MTQTIAQTQAISRIIDLTDSLPDITKNVVHNGEHHQLPSDIFEDVLFEALNDLIDGFAINPDEYLEPKHQRQIDAIAAEYLQDVDF